MEVVKVFLQLNETRRSFGSFLFGEIGKAFYINALQPFLECDTINNFVIML